MLQPSSINPDVELAAALTGHVSVGTTPVKVYSDWEHPTNDPSTDYISVYMNGDIGGVGMDTPYASGYIMVNIHCRMNADGTVKKNRVKKILEQFDDLLEKKLTENYHFEYDANRFITPTTPNGSTGYSITTLNLRWTTTSNINK